MKISSLMTDRVVAVTPDTPIRQVCTLMEENDCGALPVVEGERARGIITDRDIALRAVGAGRSIDNTTVAEIMTRNVITVREQDDVQTAVQRMKERQIRRLVVVDDTERVRGILSLGDLALHWDGDEVPGQVLRQVSEHDHRSPG